MNYGSNHAPQVPFPEGMFKQPDASIKFLRRLAQKGKEETDRIEDEEKGRPKVVWGVNAVNADECDIDLETEEEKEEKWRALVDRVDAEEAARKSGGVKTAQDGWAFLTSAFPRSPYPKSETPAGTEPALPSENHVVVPATMERNN